MTRTSGPLEARRRHQQVKERRLRGAAQDRFAEHISLHQWEAQQLKDKQAEATAGSGE